LHFGVAPPLPAAGEIHWIHSYHWTRSYVHVYVTNVSLK
jgi:hypothetical protein